MAILYAFDLYPRTNPVTGARVGRLSKLQLAEYQGAANGTGAGRIVLRGTSTDGALIDPKGLQYVRQERLGDLITLALSAAADDIVDTATPHGLAVGNKIEFVSLTGGAGLSTTPVYFVISTPTTTSLTISPTRGGASVNFTTDITAGTIRKLTTVGGFFLENGEFEALTERSTKKLTFGGAGTLSYLFRGIAADQTYIAGSDGPVGGVWHWYFSPAGAILHRMVTELLDPDRPQQPISGVTLTFTEALDSNAVAWPGYGVSWLFTIAVTEGAASWVRRLMEAGVYVWMDPDTFALSAWMATAHGRNRTGGAWGANVIRFQAPTDGTIATGNIKSDAKRGIGAMIKRSDLLVGAAPNYDWIDDPAADVVWEGGYTVEDPTGTSLPLIGAAQLTARRDAGDTVRLRMVLEDAPANGKYLPFEHVQLDDHVTLHTGTGQWDWNETEQKVAAITLTQRSAGAWDAWVDLGSKYSSIEDRAFQVQQVGGHNHPPNPRLCHPGGFDVQITKAELASGLTRIEIGYEGGGGSLTVIFDTDTDSVPKTVAVTAGVRRWFLRLNAGAYVIYSDGPRCQTTVVDSDTVEQGWEYSDLYGGAADWDDTLITLSSVGAGHPDLIGTSGQASRCGHAHHVLRGQAPTVDDDQAAGYPATTAWTDMTTGRTWVLIDATTGAADWLVISEGLAGRSFDVTPALSNAMAPWVKPTGSGVITADPQGRITIDSGANYKALPGMAFLEGRLHLVYRHGTAHNSSGGTIRHRYSNDLGRTWSAATTIVTPTAGDDTRDPAIVALSSGRLLVVYDYKTPWDGTNISSRVIYSDNRGQSWSSPYTIPDTFTGVEADVTSQPIELPDGTILVPGYGLNAGNYESVVWKSTDGGLTFPTQITVAASGVRHYAEPQIRLLASGKLVALLRSDTNQHTWRTESTDGGLTWSAPTDVLTASSRPDFVEFYPGALLFFGRNNNTQFYGRWAVSWDEGLTWTALQDIDTSTDLSMYAAPVVLAPGYVAVAYSLETSGSDADLYLRYYLDGYGTDPLGQIRANWLQVDEQSAPATPPSGKGVYYAGTDGKPYFKDDAGVVSDLAAASGLPAAVDGHGLFWDGATLKSAQAPEPLLLEDDSLAVTEDGRVAMSEPIYD